MPSLTLDPSHPESMTSLFHNHSLKPKQAAESVEKHIIDAKFYYIMDSHKVKGRYICMIHTAGELDYDIALPIIVFSLCFVCEGGSGQGAMNKQLHTSSEVWVEEKALGFRILGNFYYRILNLLILFFSFFVGI